MVKFKISRAGTLEPLLDDIHSSEKSNSADNCGDFYSEDDKLSHLFDDEMPPSEIFRVSVEGNHTANGIEACLGDNNTIRYIDEQNSDNEFCLDQIQDIIENENDTSRFNTTPFTLVNCSVTCVPSYNVTAAPPVDFATKTLYREVPRSVGRSKHQKKKAVSAASLKSIGRFGPYHSPYRGVTRHKWTGKFEAHLWDSSCSAEGRMRKGKQVYLGGYETAEDAARAHDLAALKYSGPSAIAKLNFAISNYENELEEMECMTREELVTFLRRQSLSFTRGSSIYRGVARNWLAFASHVKIICKEQGPSCVGNRKGHWQARIKVASSKKDIYLGTFMRKKLPGPYDIAAIRLKGINALTNFDISDYLQGDLKDLESIPQPKRVKTRREVSASTSDTETDSQPDGSIPLSDSPLDEIIRRKISATLPDHPTAVLPN